MNDCDVRLRGGCFRPYGACVWVGLGLMGCSLAHAAPSTKVAPVAPLVVQQSSGKPLVLQFRNGARRAYQTVDHPSRGSPVYYDYKGYLSELDAYWLEVWRIGKQTLLVPVQTGSEVAVGGHYRASPARTRVFSSDCRETHCYVQINDWPSGRRSFWLEREGGRDRTDASLLQAHVAPESVHWRSEREVAFDLPCKQPERPMLVQPAVVRWARSGWRLSLEAPCAEQ